MSDINQKLTTGLDQLSPLQRALFGLKEMRKKYDALRQERSEPIAIIGMGCRFPGGSNNLSDYWNLLSNKQSGVVEVPVERWDNALYYDPDQDAPGRISTRFAGMLKTIDTFDAAFFRITPIEARTMDPQQRLLLEVAWEALENTNIPPHSLAKSRTGVFIGIMGLDYGTNIMGSGNPEDVDAYFGTGNTLGLAAGRLSYVLKLSGPSFALDTACSSSLVALHLACRSLRDKESDMAIVGGVNLIMAPEVSISFSKAHLMAPDGQGKTFDAAANGYVRGEGCGVVCLKRLSDALQDGDRICALIRGSAVNHDGPSGGLTVPSGPAQEAVIRQALNMAGMKPEDIDYIEAHGTGTPLGDPIEVGALSKIFTNPRPRPLVIGSVKTNFGHLEAAAGMASLFKVVLGLEHQTIPAQLNFRTPNPKINWASIPVQVASEHLPWTEGERVRAAGMSGFSFGGTNAHIIVSEAPRTSITEEKGQTITPSSVKVVGDRLSRPQHILPISARSKEALKELSDRYLKLLNSSQSTTSKATIPQSFTPESSLNTPQALYFKDICHTAAIGRSHFEHRMAIVAEHGEEAISLLQTAADESPSQDIFYGKAGTPPKMVFLYTGQGSQYPNMGLELYQTQPVFRQAMDRCFDFIAQSGLSNKLPKPLAEVIFPPKTAGADGGSGESAKPLPIFSFKPRIGTSDLDNTLYTQPAMFILEYALTELWKSWGIFPNAVMGHSLGEYGAACAAGVFSPEDGLRLLIERAYLMHALPYQGKMVSVFAPLEVVDKMVEPFQAQVSVAAINGPEIILISGVATAVDEVVKELENRRVRTIQVNISTAFHSPLTQQIMEDFRRHAQMINYHTPLVPVISNLTGEPIGDEICNPDYWCRHMRQPVQFVKSLLYIRRNYDTILEIGPSPNLIDLDMTLPEGFGVAEDSNTRTSMRRLASLSPRISATRRILWTLSELYVAGVDVDWNAFEQPFNHSKVMLPNYPFQRERHWIDRAPVKPAASSEISLTDTKTPASELTQKNASTQTQSSNPVLLPTHEPMQEIRVHDLHGNTVEQIMIQQIETMNQLMKRHLEVLKTK